MILINSIKECKKNIVHFNHRLERVAIIGEKCVAVFQLISHDRKSTNDNRILSLVFSMDDFLLTSI